MKSNASTKLKILYILKILHEQTDESHKLTVHEIIDQLSSFGIKAERKSIYTDIELLNDFGYDILCEKGRANKYCLASREFELPELKLLIDSVMAARFITLKKSEALVSRLQKQVSKHEAKELNRNLIIGNRIKSNNEGIYYNVDTINKAINDNKKVGFKYFDYSLGNEITYRHEGEIYEVSPYTLMWNEENYYLVAYHTRYKSISNFRVDRMDHIVVMEEERYTKGIVLPFDEVNYGKKIFRMFSGEPNRVCIEFDQSLLNAMYDRFGHDLKVISCNDEILLAEVEVVASETFLAWVFMFGVKMKIVSPEAVVEGFSEMMEKVKELYN